MGEPTLNGGGSARRRMPSLLPPALQRLLAAAVGLAGFMLADTVYLLLVRLADRVELEPFALGATSLPRIYQVLLLAHTGVGLLLAALMVVFLVAHLPRVWRRYHPEAAWTGAPYAAIGVGGGRDRALHLLGGGQRGNSWSGGCMRGRRRARLSPTRPIGR